MEKSYNIKGLLLCFLVTLCASWISGTESDALNLTSLADPKENIKEEDNNFWDCPFGWISYSSNNEVKCLWLDKQPRTFDDARTHCSSSGGDLVIFPRSEKETFVKSIAQSGGSGEYWIGLSKPTGYDKSFRWQSIYTEIKEGAESLPSQMRYYYGYSAQCVYIHSLDNTLELDNCESEYASICEKEASCKTGHFGSRCERECHCVGELCSNKTTHHTEDVICKYGCQRNWMGAACDKEKQNPDVKYYCINSPGENGKYVDIHIFTKGVHYRAIYGLTSTGSRGDWCNSTTFDSSDDTYVLTTIRIPVDDNIIEQISTGMCVGKQLSENIFSWAIVVKENDGILLNHDLVVNVTCNFNVADSLIRSDKYSIHGEPRHVQQETFTPESIQDDVILQVVNAFSGEAVTEAEIGSTVVLQIKYGLQKGTGLKGVFPYNCIASSLDGKNIKQLLNAVGCQSPNSPLQPFTRTDKNKVVTPWFSLFAFEDEQSVTFQCSFKLCFTDDCNVGCKESQRSRRDTQDQKDEERHSTTRTIRVLPSIPAQKSSNDNHNPEYQPGRGGASAPAGYEVGPFVYLNPVTCTLFLLILLIFMCMYIAFLRTLRKSVYDIRKEIEIKRSRDKFLHCGCAQQKDRDYIVA
uniref:ZP domain-containing protein n=1 Tax=Arion vulgaris TaxID=1028688 RepID=A0A0B7A451_9EUPU